MMVLIKLIVRLNKWYKKDNLSAAYDAWTKFDACKRLHDVTMDNYMSEFMRRNNDMKKYNVKIPNSILAFMLLDNAGLDFKDKQLAVTGVSFEDEDKMLDLMQKSLKKSFSSQDIFSDISKACSTGANASSITIKSEPSFKTEEINATQRMGRSDYRGYAGNRGRSRGRNLNYGRWSFKNA